MSAYTLANEAKTARVAQAIAGILRGGLSLGFSGELGAGKTTFIRYLVTAAGGDARAVSSPTYTLQHEYKLPNGLLIEHWDLYRLTSLPEELEERIPTNVIRLIEWPERCPELISSLSCVISISSHSDGSRVIEIAGAHAGEFVGVLDTVVGRS